MNFLVSYLTKQSLVLFLAFFFPISHLICQASLDDMFSAPSENSSTDGFYICISDTIYLQETPTSSTPIQTILFGESVQVLEESFLFPSDSNTYLKVQSMDGYIGWLPDSILIPNGELAVILSPMRIYKRPATPSTVTNHMCMPGELLILTGNTIEWGASVITNKGIKGWLHQPNEYLSTEITDVEMGKMLSVANLTTDSSQKRRIWGEILELIQQNQSHMATILLTAYHQTYPTEKLSDTSMQTIGVRAVSPPPSTLAEWRQTSEEFWDSKTNTWLTQIEESGPIQIRQINTEGQQIYQAAHKSLAIGTKILLAIPQQQGYIEMEITDSMPPNSPYFLGLSQQIVDLFLGVRIPDEMSIFYVKK